MKTIPALCLDDVAENLQALKLSCVEAQTGAWDKSDEGFDAMFELLSNIQTQLGITDDFDYGEDCVDE